MMKATKTFTPTSFRKHNYKLFSLVGAGKRYVPVTVRTGKSKPNNDVVVVNRRDLTKLIHENKELKQQELAQKIDKLSSKLSSNPVIHNSKQLNKWFKDNDG